MLKNLPLETKKREYNELNTKGKADLDPLANTKEDEGTKRSQSKGKA